MNETDFHPDERQRSDADGNIYMGRPQSSAQDGNGRPPRQSAQGNVRGAYPPKGDVPGWARVNPNLQRTGQMPNGRSMGPRGAYPPGAQNPYVRRETAPQQSRQDLYMRTPPPAEADAEAPEETGKRSGMDPKDKKQILVLGLLDVAVFLFIIGFVLLKGNSGIVSILGLEFKTRSDGYYNAAEALSDLTPNLQSTAYPDGIDPEMMPLYSENNDVVGWLRIPGTGIDNVVVQGQSNETYLRADFYHQYNKRTRLFFADFRNNFARSTQDYSKVTIIYGHHLSTDTRIFAELENYANVEYYRKHPVVEFHTLYGKTTWKVFGAFYTAVDVENDEGSTFYYWNPSVSDAETAAFCNEILTRSSFINPAVDIQPTDKILCLSTCTYIIKNNYDNRCVLMARLVREGENPEVDVSAAYANPDRRMPHAWYVQQGISDPYENTPVFSAGVIG